MPRFDDDQNSGERDRPRGNFSRREGPPNPRAAYPSARGDRSRAATDSGPESRVPDDRPRLPYHPDVLRPRPLAPAEGEILPVIESRVLPRQPWLYRKMLGKIDHAAKPGDWVRVTAGNHETVGFGLYNPRAEMSVRILTPGTVPPTRDWWIQRLQAAVDLRLKTLRLNEVSDAYRLIHAEADGFPGLIIDRYGDVLSLEAFSLGIYQRANAIFEALAPICGTKHTVLRSGPYTIEQENFSAPPIGSAELPDRFTIQEFGTKFRIDFVGGHKTGFFCDQRDNRRKLAELTAGKTVLDLCTYTGGFALQAARLGNAAEVTGVDLDEDAIAIAKENARLNKLKTQFVHADVFPYLRDMQRNGRTYDVVVLDPPKLIRNRDEIAEGKHKYFDFNRLAAQLVAPGGWLVTCSCSGLLDQPEFAHLVSAAVESHRRGQILWQTGASPDHPVSTNCLETSYLKLIWMRME